MAESKQKKSGTEPAGGAGEEAMSAERVEAMIEAVRQADRAVADTDQAIARLLHGDDRGDAEG